MNRIRKIVEGANRIVNIFLIDLGIFTPEVDTEVSKDGWHFNLVGDLRI